MLILGVIQARMNSKRLPGKVLFHLLGKPVIGHIYERLTYSTKIDEICISTSTNPSDNPIVEYATQAKIKYFRGSEENIISRLLNTAKKFDADVIVRVTGDDPLIDPKIIDRLISLYLDNPSVDFVSNNKVRTFPIGLDVEVIPVKTLEKFFPISKDPIFFKYFIGMYIFEHPETYKSLGIELDNPKLFRWTLDYPEDYEFMKQIYSKLYKPGSIFYMEDIFSLLEKYPKIMKINSMHNQKFSHLNYQNEKKSD